MKLKLIEKQEHYATYDRGNNDADSKKSPRDQKITAVRATKSRYAHSFATPWAVSLVLSFVHRFFSLSANDLDYWILGFCIPLIPETINHKAKR